MEETHPFHPDALSNGVGPHLSPFAATPLLAPPENLASKRQRRPSVRLGEIGDQPAATAAFSHDPHHRRSNRPPWRPSNKDQGAKSSKIRPLAKLSAAAGGGGMVGVRHETLDSDEGEEKEEATSFDNLAIVSWTSKECKFKRAMSKRPRTKWLPRIADGGGGGVEGSQKYSGRRARDVHDNYYDFVRDFEPVGSEEQSPGHSIENLGADDDGHRRGGHGIGLRFSRRTRRGARGGLGDHHRRNHFHHDNNHVGVNMDGRSDNYRNDGLDNSGGGCGGGGGSGSRCNQEAVKIWLSGLGLGRYWPVFEIHEVDEEVLPMLTLEDLKDMGINAVGSRRKMYSAIQKLGKGFS